MFGTAVDGASVKELTNDALVAEIDRCHQARCRLDAREAAVLGELEGRSLAHGVGAVDGGAWLKGRTGVARSTARARVDTARQLAVLPDARQALADGGIGFDHARQLAEVANSARRDEVFADQTDLVGVHVRRSVPGSPPRLEAPGRPRPGRAR